MGPESFNPSLLRMFRTLFTRCLPIVLLSVVAISAHAQSITVLSPNGGEIWQAGTAQTIRWESSGITDELEVQYTTDGAQWRRISRVSSSTTQLSWLVENRPSQAAQIRVITRNEDVSDVSNGVFAITPDPLDQLRIISPNGGETLTSGSYYKLLWQAPLDATQVLLEYSTNFGVNWSPIATVAATSGEYSWLVPTVGDKPVTTAIVRASMPEDVEEFDASDAAFTIIPQVVVTPAAITVTYPNGGENLEGSSSVNLTWFYTPASNEGQGEGPGVIVQYSTNGGFVWTNIATEDAEAGSHNWVVPNLNTTSALVRVIAIGSSLGDTSDAVFSIEQISSPASLIVTSPNGGEVWTEGEMHEVSWATDGEFGEARIYLETIDQNDHVSREQLAIIAATAGKISWLVPSLASEPLQARIIIESNGLVDTSNASFTILPKGALEVGTRKDLSVGFYPNPAQDIVTFTWTPSSKNAVVAKLFNSSGAVVRTTSVSGHSTELTMAVHDLPQGAYFYELSSEGQISRGSLTIKR